MSKQSQVSELITEVNRLAAKCDRKTKRIAELERGRDIQKGNAERWEALAMQYKREIERLRALLPPARIIANKYTGFHGHVELVRALAALNGVDDE